MNLTSVNLLWQKRLRGLAAVGLHSVSDGGEALLIRPDDLETRTYQLLQVDAGGGTREAGALSIQTVHKFDGLPDGSLLLAMTHDDLYICREGRKSRFMPEHHVVYSDISLAAEGNRFICGYSNTLYTTHGLALGDVSGRLGWSKELCAIPNRVASGSDGSVLCAGLQDGRIVCLDGMRNVLWEHPQPGPISALAVVGTGPCVAAGTQDGTVMLLDEEGGIRWRSPVGLPVIGLAVARQAECTTAVLSDGGAHLLVCFDAGGEPVWEHDLDAKPSGVGLSSNGRFLLLSTANSTVSLFEVDLSTSPDRTTAARERALTNARSADEEGDLERSHGIFEQALIQAPHDVPLAEALVSAGARLREQHRREAREQMAAGGFARALEALDAAFRLDPWDADLFAERAECRRRALEELRQRAAELEAKRQWQAASAAWLELLRLDPLCVGARAALAEVRRQEAADLLDAGDRAQAQGQAEQAVALWREARALHPTDELEDRLRRAQADQCLAAGIAYYEAQRMAEAAFQFKKAVALDPDNEQAARYLGYTQGTGGKELIADRFARLE
jgi:tetratricopeptide (TPR) repeat protein